jgi:hypothetical protein
MFSQSSWRDSGGGSSGDRSSWLRDSGWGGRWQEEQPAQAAAATNSGSSWSWWDDSSASATAAPMEEDGVRQEESSSSSGAEAASASAPSAASSSPWLATMHQRVTPQPKFKPLAKVAKSSTSAEASQSAVKPAAANSTSAAAAPAPAAAPVAPLFKPVRFVKSKHTLGASDSEPANSSSAAAAPAVVKSGTRVSLLSRVPPPAALVPSAPAAAKPVTSLRDTPSLLTKKVGSSTAGAASQLLRPAGSTAALELALIFTCSYSLAGRKKRQHREGFLHLFKSTLQPTATASGSAAAAAASSPAAPLPASFLKSHLFSERGLLLDEQIGRDVMQFEEQLPQPKRQRQQGGGFGHGGLFEQGSLWAPLPQERRKQIRRGDEVDDSDDSEEGEEAAPRTEPADRADAAGGNASVPARIVHSNTFAAGECVTLGRYECVLEEEISKVEFDRKTKILSQLHKRERELAARWRFEQLFSPLLSFCLLVSSAPSSQPVS